jgi:photosystem II stability/assembly factor-like uncharacterized protein
MIGKEALMFTRAAIVLLVTLLIPIAGLEAQTYDPALFQALEYRPIGPFRGGRVTAVEGIAEQPFTFFHGATGGGVWKTTNAGQSWMNISDGYFEAGSIGSIDVADSDTNVIYVGTGSACMRGNVSTGIGVYKSVDGGKSWTHAGLREAGQIGRIVVHPKDPDVVYLAAMGHPFGPNPERGVFRSLDGGANWEKILYISEYVGAIDLSMNPSNPRELYAAMWRGERKPWTMISGGEEGGIYKTTDAGDNWKKLESGLPTGLIGKIGVTVSPRNPSRVWAIIEAEEGQAGVYRSDDAGASWSLICDDPRVQSRPWYYHHIYADPASENTVWIAGGRFWKSVDGGKTFTSFAMPHGDHHDLWINPVNTAVMVEGNDGGANVSLDGGLSWSTQLNQPTAEFYSVTVDNQFPYRVYGPQQDNSTISVPSQATGPGISLQHWISHGGCENGPVAVRPDNPNITYSGCFGGRLGRFDKRSEQFRQIRDYPQEQGGMPERELRYRFQWNAPITISPHDPDILYHGSQYVHRSTNEGQSWDVVSPDLTGNDEEKFDMAGGPITHDVTGVEIYSALLVIEESPHERGVIWTGSNDGKVFLTRDNGGSWNDITPKDMPQPATVNRIELSPHEPGKAYLAVYRYRLDDFRPFVYRTEDYGQSWELLTEGENGIPPTHPVRTVREDPVSPGLLFVGTEFALFVSFDDGKQWQSLQLNLPHTPVTDLRVHRDDLVVATQGRSFWILDDMTPLRQINGQVAKSEAHLFEPRVTYRTGAQDGPQHYRRDHVYGAMIPASWKAQNPPEGAIIYYYVSGDADAPTLEILDDAGRVVRAFEGNDVPHSPGMHRFVWDLRYPGPETARGMAGPRAVPGTYQVKLTVGDWAQTQSFEVKKDPRLTEITQEDLEEQFEFLMQIRKAFNDLHRGLETLSSVRRQVKQVADRLDEHDDIQGEATALVEKLTTIENEVVQTKPGGWSQQPKILRNLSWVATATSSQRGEYTDARPTDQLKERFSDLRSALDEHLAKLQQLLDGDVERFNTLLRDKNIAPVILLK